MLTDEQRAAGWREHDGEPCPVPLDSKPGVMLRGGYITQTGRDCASFWSAAPDMWRHMNQWGDIIAYLPEADNADR